LNKSKEREEETTNNNQMRRKKVNKIFQKWTNTKFLSKIFTNDSTLIHKSRLKDFLQRKQIVETKSKETTN